MERPQPPEPGCAFSVTIGLVSAVAGSAVGGSAASIASAIAAAASDLCRRSRGRAMRTASPGYVSPTAIGGLVADKVPFAESATVIVWLGGVIRVALKVWIPASWPVKV